VNERAGETPRSGNSAGMVMGGINLAMYPEEHIPHQSRISAEAAQPRRGAQDDGKGKTMNDETRALLNEFANTLEAAAALARKISEMEARKFEIRLDELPFLPVSQLTNCDNPEASTASSADSG